MIKLVKVTLGALAFTVLSTPPATASVTVNVEQSKVVRSVDPNGVTIERSEPLDSVVPGEVVQYRYVVRNDGVMPADDIAINTAVPENMSYLAGSAHIEAVNSVLSADKGASFAREQDLMFFDVDETWRPARPEEVTNIRWTLDAPLPPGAVSEVSFRARLR